MKTRPLLILAFLPLFGCATMTPEEKAQARAVGLAIGRAVGKAALDLAVEVARQKINGLESLPAPKGLAK